LGGQRATILPEMKPIVHVVRTRTLSNGQSRIFLGMRNILTTPIPSKPFINHNDDTDFVTDLNRNSGNFLGKLIGWRSTIVIPQKREHRERIFYYNKVSSRNTCEYHSAFAMLIDYTKDN